MMILVIVISNNDDDINDNNAILVFRLVNTTSHSFMNGVKTVAT